LRHPPNGATGEAVPEGREGSRPMICVLSLVVGLAGFGVFVGAISKIVRVGRQQQAEQKLRAALDK
jgi:hypothetical protein